MPAKRKFSRKKVDYAANVSDRRRLASYMNKTNFNSVSGYRYYNDSEIRLRLFLSGTGLILLLIGLFFVIF